MARLLMEKLRVNILLVSYRGYGDSEGTPSQEGLLKDAKAAFQFVKAKISRPKIIIYGQSIGCAVALSLLVSLENLKEISCMILENPFLSISSIIPSLIHCKSRCVKFFCKKFLIKDDWNNEEAISSLIALENASRYRVPTLILTGFRDEMIPHDDHSQVLFRLLTREEFREFRLHFANKVASFWSDITCKQWSLFENGTHNDTWNQEGMMMAQSVPLDKSTHSSLGPDIQSASYLHNNNNNQGDSDDAEGPSPWIEWFLSQPEHSYFVEVEEEFILDRFNLTGLPAIVPNFQQALDRITLESEDVDSVVESNSGSGSESSSFTHNDSAESSEPDVGNSPTQRSCGSEEGESSSLKRRNQHDANRLKRQIHTLSLHLYGLIHARYITTSSGMARMHAKWRTKSFGTCPRVFCRGFGLLPVGTSDVPEKSTLVLYCGNCDDIYRPKSTRFQHIDGAYFGTSFPHLFFQQYKNARPQTKHTDYYIPKIYGFKLHHPQKIENQIEQSED